MRTLNLGLLCLASTMNPCVASSITDWFVFPHVFNLDESNYTVIHAQNEQEGGFNLFQVSYFDSNGTLVFSDGRPLEGHQSAEFLVPEGFVGTAYVDCNNWCTATGIWKISLPGQEGFEVGIPPNNQLVHSQDRSVGTVQFSSWAGPVPPVDLNSRLGLALKVFGGSYPDPNCSIEYFARSGELAAIDSITIPARGTVALLSQNVPGNVPADMLGPDGFSGSLIMKCSVDVVPLVIVQDQTNGFPTLIHLEPYYLDLLNP